MYSNVIPGGNRLFALIPRRGHVRVRAFEDHQNIVISELLPLRIRTSDMSEQTRGLSRVVKHDGNVRSERRLAIMCNDRGKTELANDFEQRFAIGLFGVLRDIHT